MRGRSAGKALSGPLPCTARDSGRLALLVSSTMRSAVRPDQFLQMVELGAEGADPWVTERISTIMSCISASRHQRRDLVPAVPAGACLVAQDLAAPARDQPLHAAV